MATQNCWIIKYVVGNPATHRLVTTDAAGPIKRADALSGAAKIAANGWRCWVEHATTGKRIFESEAEKAHQPDVKQLQARLAMLLKASQRVLWDVDDDGYAEKGDIAVDSLREAVAMCKAEDPVPAKVTPSELQRAVEEFGAAGFPVDDETVAFLNYFLSQRLAAFHWREAPGARSESAPAHSPEASHA